MLPLLSLASDYLCFLCSTHRCMIPNLCPRPLDPTIRSTDNHQATQSTIRSIKSVVPLLDRVLVQRFKPETKTATGIFLPSSVASSPLPEASVIATGPGAPDKDGKIVPTSVKSGDKVLLPSWGGNSIKVGENEYLLIRDSEILAKINE